MFLHFTLHEVAAHSSLVTRTVRMLNFCRLHKTQVLAGQLGQAGNLAEFSPYGFGRGGLRTSARPAPRRTRHRRS